MKTIWICISAVLINPILVHTLNLDQIFQDTLPSLEDTIVDKLSEAIKSKLIPELKAQLEVEIMDKLKAEFASTLRNKISRICQKVTAISDRIDALNETLETNTKANAWQVTPNSVKINLLIAQVEDNSKKINNISERTNDRFYPSYYPN